MIYMGIIGQGCRLSGLRGLSLYASDEMAKARVPASECAFRSCDSSCCSDGCRLSYEDLVELGPFMEAVSRSHSLRRAGFRMKFMGQSGEPGYECLRGFIDSLAHHRGCVFQDKGSGGCLLHQEALGRGLDWRKMKPFTCVLYPVRMRFMPEGPARGVLLKPSREHSICRSLTHRKAACKSQKTYLEAKAQDIRALFDLQTPPSSAGVDERLAVSGSALSGKSTE